MREKIIRALINGMIGMLTSIATIYLGASATEVVALSSATAGAVGGRLSDVAMSLFS